MSGICRGIDRPAPATVRAPGDNGQVSRPAPSDPAAPDDADRETRDRARTGWILVGVQVVLLIALVFLPRRSSLAWPLDVLEFLGILLMIAGLGLLLISLLSLGRALTPTPVPVTGAGLRTSGIYGIVRHPIYVGVLVAGLGFTLAVGSVWQVIAWFCLLGFFLGKAFWEDRLLAERHGVAWYDYADYVGGFFPRLWANR